MASDILLLLFLLLLLASPSTVNTLTSATWAFLVKGLDGRRERSFLPVCDPDGDTGSGPDTDPDFSATTLDGLCPGGVAELEFDVDRRFGLPAGDGMVTGRLPFSRRRDVQAHADLGVKAETKIGIGQRGRLPSLSGEPGGSRITPV